MTESGFTEGELREALVFNGEPCQIAPLEVLTVEGAAEYLQFHPDTVREMARNGEIPGKKIEREWRFSRRALLDFVEGKKIKAPRREWGGFTDAESDERRGE